MSNMIAFCGYKLFKWLYLFCLVPTVVIALERQDVTSSLLARQQRCSNKINRLSINDPPYGDYFYSDCNSASQVVVTSPLRSSNLKLIGPRLLVAWPAGNSGAVAFFAPTNGKNGTLSLELVKPKAGGFLSPIHEPKQGNPLEGISGLIRLNSSAILNLALLGSVRTIRDFTEGPSILVPKIQNAIKVSKYQKTGGLLSRRWLDNVTTTYLSFEPVYGTSAVQIKNKKLSFAAGMYRFKATFDYPQLTSLGVSAVLNPASQNLITQQPDRAKSLAFFSYTDKLLAGGWRFLTYFGRDSLISLLLMQPVLSSGKGGAIEAVISAAIERINRKSGAVCHEETIGDYATYLHQMDGMTSTKPICSYIMIDSDYYLPIVMNNYFVLTRDGKARTKPFFAQKATTDFGNRGISYSHLALRNAQSIMKHAERFAKNPIKANLRHLKPNQIVGEWRDSELGLGYGRIPFDVNTALVPAALRAIGSLNRAGFFPEQAKWFSNADRWARVWEDRTLKFFSVTVPRTEAKALVRKYAEESGFKGPTNANNITDDIKFHAIALNGGDDQSHVRVMHTDIAYRLFLLNTTNDPQLSSLLTKAANQILLRFPAGLSTDAGILVANPAYGGIPAYAKNFTTADYHGTVVWSWQLSMLAKGLEHQLGRCYATPKTAVPKFCLRRDTFALVKKAYNHLWDVIEQNREQLSGEVWSWKYDVKNDLFKVVDLGTLTATESDVRQLWSLTFLAVRRNPAFRG